MGLCLQVDRRRCISSFSVCKRTRKYLHRIYWQFVWLAPFIVYDGIKCVQNKEFRFEWIAEIILVLSVLVLTPMVLQEWLSAYYFYKIYYPLFMFSVVIAASAIVKLIDEKNLLFPSMMVMMAIPFAMNFCFIENKLVSSPTNIQSRNNSSGYIERINNIENIIEKINKKETEYVFNLRKSAFYLDHESILKDYLIVYENTGLIVYSTE